MDVGPNSSMTKKQEGKEEGATNMHENVVAGSRLEMNRQVKMRHPCMGHKQYTSVRRGPVRVNDVSREKATQSREL